MAEEVFEPVGFMSPQIFGIPVDRDIQFSNHKNVYRKRTEKRQRKLIVKLAFIKPFLRKGEKVLLITTGYSPLSSPAQYLTGFVFIYLKRSLFVFTNFRIIHVPTTPSYDYRNSIAQIAYGGCQSIVLKGGTLTVQYAQLGKTEKFRGIARAERKKIKALLKKNIPLSGTKTHLAGRYHLCPRCAHKLSDGKYVCEKCQQKFKNKIGAAILAILFPGGGYFYTRHYLLGFLDALLEIFLIVYIAFIVNDIVHAIRPSLVQLVLIPAIFIFVKLAAVVHSTHFISEFIPVSTYSTKTSKRPALKTPASSLKE